MMLDGVTRFCFGASYAVALGLELAQQFWPRPSLRISALGFGAAGLVAHTAFLFLHRPSPASPTGSLLLLAWVVAIFYLYGTVHYRRLAWAVFVLPLVLVLVAISELVPRAGTVEAAQLAPVAERFWGILHGSLLFLTAVGVSVGFLASVMYLVQARRVRAKVTPGQGMKLLSLERLEEMNRRAINAAFPLLTVGLLLGAVLLAHRESDAFDWASPKVLGTMGLWLVFLVLLYLRYGAHVPGRRLALLTIAAFGLLLVTLVASHPAAVTGAVP